MGHHDVTWMWECCVRCCEMRAQIQKWKMKNKKKKKNEK
jgi:hypothetical protein